MDNDYYYLLIIIIIISHHCVLEIIMYACSADKIRYIQVHPDEALDNVLEFPKS